MKAIIETGGKQYFIEEGKEIYVELLGVEPNNEVVFDKVVMYDGVFGKPYVDNVKVIGEVIKNGKQKKITVLHYRQKNNFHKKQGHRQPYTLVSIKKIETK
jgi:large subunit ribosomal protein L21